MSDLSEALIGEEEGRVGHVYPDTRGLLTIGIGCLVDPKVAGAGLCDAAIDAQFAHDSVTARSQAAQFPFFDQLNEVRKAVLVSMCFQMGTKPLHWPHFMAALQAKDYMAAADAGLDSDWANQTRNRALRAMEMLSSGNWVAKT